MNYWSTAEALLDVSPRDDRWPEGFDVIARMRDMADGAGTVLDFGCGDGRLVPAFDSEKYIGVDINRFAVEKCRAEYPEYRFELAGEQLPCADLAICYAVLLHISDGGIEHAVLRLAAACARVVVAEVMGRKFRGRGNPPVFQREAREYITLFAIAGMHLCSRTEEEYRRYGGVQLTIMEFAQRCR